MQDREPLLYVFGVGAHSPDDLDDALCTIKHRDLVVFCAWAPRATFGEEALRERMQDHQWLAKQALWHQNHVQRLFEQLHAMIPFRFGTLFNKKEHLLERVNEKYTEWISLLNKLRGYAEWELQAFPEEEELEQVLQARDPEWNAQQQAMAQASPGKRYLLRKQSEQIRQEALRKQHRWFCEQMQQKTTQWPYEVRWVKVDDQSHQNPPVCRLALLGPFQQPVRFEEDIIPLFDTIPHDGYRFVLKGPWPPYHFV